MPRYGQTFGWSTLFQQRVCAIDGSAMFLMVLDQSRAGKKQVCRRLRCDCAGLSCRVVTALILPFFLGVWKPLVSLGLMLALWIGITSVLNIRDRVKVASGQSTVLQKLKTQSRSYYGMHLAHLGVAVFIVGVTLVTGYQSEQDVRMDIGDTVHAGNYTFRLNGITNVTGPNYRAARADIEVSKTEML